MRFCVLHYIFIKYYLLTIFYNIAYFIKVIYTYFYFWISLQKTPQGPKCQKRQKHRSIFKSQRANLISIPNPTIAFTDLFSS